MRIELIKPSKGFPEEGIPGFYLGQLMRIFDNGIIYLSENKDLCDLIHYEAVKKEVGLAAQDARDIVREHMELRPLVPDDMWNYN